MVAIIKKDGFLFKVYDQGQDFQVIVTNENGHAVKERWFGKWSHDIKGSLNRVFTSMGIDIN